MITDRLILETARQTCRELLPTRQVRPLGKQFIRAGCAARSTRGNPLCTRIFVSAGRNRNSTASFAAGGSSTSTDCSRILRRMCTVKDFDNENCKSVRTKLPRELIHTHEIRKGKVVGNCYGQTF